MPLRRRRFLQLFVLGLASFATRAIARGQTAPVGGASPRYPVSDHFDGERFFNPNGNNPRGFRALLKWQFSREQGAWPDWIENPVQPTFPTQLAPGECAVTFVNHVTFLVQFAGLNLLTDPVWSERVSPVTFAGPKRVHAPGIAFEQLPHIDVVLVSHNHYDHLDLATLKRLHAAHRPLFVTTLGNKEFLEGEGLTNVVELDWWQTHAARPDLQVTVTPAQHFAARGLGDRFKTLWGGFALTTPHGKLYFAGDSGYFDGFKQVGAKLGPFDLAFIPIGAYEPRWFMEPVHVTPAEALQVHKDVRARRSLAMHFGCFPLADDGFDQPVRDLEAARPASGVSAEEFAVPRVGETRVFKLA